MRTSITVFALSLLLAGSAVKAQNSWQIGLIGAKVTATLNNGTLTISGTGQMYIQANYRSLGGFTPWYDQKDQITTVIINNGVTNISPSAFADHVNLRSISIPGSVTTIGRSTFSNCSLTSVTIPNTVTQIDEDAFSSNSGLTGVVFEDGKTTLNFGYYGRIFFANCPIESLYLGRNMVQANDNSGNGSSPFKNNTKLRSVTIGNQVTSIGGAAFYGCTGLTSVKLGNSITSIGNAAFQYTGIAGITLPDGVAEIGEAAFDNSELTAIKIPVGVTSIDRNAFASCSRLKNVNFEEGKMPLKSGDGAFNQTPVEILYIGRNIQGAWNSIPEIFSKNTKLRSVTFGDNVTSIGNSAFAGCTGLTRAIIGEGITSIGSSAFQFTELTEILCKNPTPPSVGRDCFNGVNKTGCKLYITPGSQNAYKSANEWKDFLIVLNQPAASRTAPASTQPKSNPVQTTQVKPRITSPSDRSGCPIGNQVNVIVEDSNIEIKYVGLNGSPNPENTNESQNGFYTGFMYQTGSNFFFTPNNAIWSNKWVKIIAHDKITDIWSDPVYVQIKGVLQSSFNVQSTSNGISPIAVRLRI